MRHTRAALSTRPLGTLLQANSTKVVVGLSLVLLVFCVALRSSKLDSQLTSWIQRTKRVEASMSAAGGASEPLATGTTSQLLLQTPRLSPDVLTVEALMIHLEALAIATHVTVYEYGVTWSLEDLCYTPTVPDYDGISVELLETMIPCAIKTPLDCFWEGAKLLGPKQPVTLGHIMGPLPKWTSLNPIAMVEAMERGMKNTQFPFQTLIAWMRRVGITTGYQYKPCLDPTDPNCPTTAPNKYTGEPPNIGAHLTGGCKGLAANHWHWKEEEIVGGLVKNNSGYIVEASALQSTIQLMDDQDMYDYYIRTKKVLYINNWSADKAKLILDAWQDQFKKELTQFLRTSSSSKSFQLHTTNSKRMEEPIDQYSLLDLTTFQLCFLLMTLFSCISFPCFNCDETSIKKINIIVLAIVASSFVGITFLASLGLSSFMNLPFNMATTQILPVLALYLGFNQLIMIANIYSQRLTLKTSMDDLTTDCLNELLPVVRIESMTSISALLVAAVIIPVEATRVFAFQAILYIVMASMSSILLIPCLIQTFLSYYTYSDDSNIEEQIFSRIQDDLKNIKADSPDINFSATLIVGGRQTNFNLTASQPRQLDCNTPPPNHEQTIQQDTSDTDSSIASLYAVSLTTNRYVQFIICMLTLGSLITIKIQAPNVKYGLLLRDIVARDTSEYEPLSVREKYFPAYNVFMTTKGNFDYPTNQKLLHEFYRSIEEVDGIVKDGEPVRFWLIRFRSWLMELQQEFDSEYSKYNKSLASSDDWTQELSDTSKLAYKLLAQTGKLDNPVDRSIVETNRLVDENNIINPKAFYYYLTAWVSKDPFTYSFTEANFKPEPNALDDNPNNLKIEKARPLTSAQIPFLMNFPTNQDNLKTISEIRSKSEAFEQLNLPNFPTGVPFIFLDRFHNLDLLFLTATTITIVSVFIIIVLTTLDLKIAAIMTLTILLTLLELYSFMSYSTIPFNDILAALLIGAIGIATHNVHYIVYFVYKEGDLVGRTQASLKQRSRIVLSSLGLFFICASVFQISRFDFIIKYSYLLLILAILNSLNSLLLTPVILCLLGSEYKAPVSPPKENKIRLKEVQIKRVKNRIHSRTRRKRVQSEISLSTISEEPHLSQPEMHDLKFDFSIKCY